MKKEITKTELEEMKDYFNELGDIVEKGYCLKKRLIYIQGDILENECNKWLRIISLLNELNDEPITVVISSDGGYVYDGLGVYDSLRHSKSHIITKCYSKACSMGFILFLAGDERILSKNASLMHHNLSGGTFGNINRIRNDITEMERLNKRLENIIIERTTLTKEEIHLKHKLGDAWYDSKTAKTYNICTKIL